jgi:hypothetical protein
MRHEAKTGWIAIILVLGFCTSIGGWAIGQPIGGPAVKTTPTENAYRQLEASVCEQLKPDRVWSDPRSRESLMGFAQAAGVLRTPAAVPLLVKHLNYDAYPDGENRNVPPKFKFPAAGALIEIGLPAVPALLELLKSAPPLDTNSDTDTESMEVIMARRDLQQRAAIGLLCMVRIYEQGGHGKMMARHLIEEEIKTAKPEVAATLKKLLDWPALKIEEKK